MVSTPKAGREPVRLRVPTGRGDAELILDGKTRAAAGLLVLGHGAGGDIDAVDLLAVRDAAIALGLVVVRVVQPYRVVPDGQSTWIRRPPPAAAALDEAWTAAVAAARAKVGPSRPLVVGGRSAGARVAARTAVALGALGVLALAFPTHPPGKPDSLRTGELDPSVPTLVVNGDRDPFGIPEPMGSMRLVVRPGEGHELRRDPVAVGAIAGDWLAELLGLARAGA